MFSRINEAYVTLSDEYNRARFHAMQSMSEKDIKALAVVKKSYAARDIDLMAEALARTVSFEKERDGLIITAALYGELEQLVDPLAALCSQVQHGVVEQASVTSGNPLCFDF